MSIQNIEDKTLTKELILEKIREVCGLKKLEFGCEVEYSYFTEVSYEVLGREIKKGVVLGDKGTFYKDGQYLKSVPKGVKNVNVKGFGGDVFCAEEIDETEMFTALDIINPTYITKIIGLPVQLNHLLFALEEKLQNTDKVIYVSSAGGMIYLIDTQKKYEAQFNDLNHEGAPYNLQLTVEENLNQNPELLKLVGELILN